MTWREDIEGLLTRLPQEFRVEDVYRFVPFLHARHPDNYHVEEKIRQVLQQLRSEKKLTFMDNRGSYSKLEAPGDAIETLPLAPGQLTTRSELATLLGQAGDAALRRGMFKPARGAYRNHMFLFHNETENRYGDVH